MNEEEKSGAEELFAAMRRGEVEPPRHLAILWKWEREGGGALRMVLRKPDLAATYLRIQGKLRPDFDCAFAAYIRFDGDAYEAACLALSAKVGEAISSARVAVQKDAAAFVERFRHRPPRTALERTQLAVLELAAAGKWTQALARMRLAGAN